MIVEYAQLLSTAHRVLDGKLIQLESCKHKLYEDGNGVRSYVPTYNHTKAYMLETDWPAEYDLDKLEPIEIVYRQKLNQYDYPIFDYTDQIWNKKCYLATHVNHPSAKWVRESSSNYEWLYSLFVELNLEFLYRYPGKDKIHKTFSEFNNFLSKLPKNISIGNFTNMALAMPEQYRTNNAIESYRQYYIKEKHNLANWKLRGKPSWYQGELNDK